MLLLQLTAQFMNSTNTEMTETWKIEETNFPATGTSAEKLEFLLRYAVLAPSTRNTQPWQFHVTGSKLELYADRGRTCPVSDPDGRELIMSCGCALQNLLVAATHFNCLGKFELFPAGNNEDLLARIVISYSASPTNAPDLFYELTRRRTNRQPFKEQSVPSALLTTLQWIAHGQKLWLHVVEEPAAKEKLGELVAEADGILWGDQLFCDEAVKWLYPGSHPRRDGIPTYAQGPDDLLPHNGDGLLSSSDLGQGVGARDQLVAYNAPALAVLGSSEDEPAAWLRTGLCLERILLRASYDDVTGSFLNQPIQVPQIRPRLLEAIGRDGFPQILLRLGFGEHLKPTPRRDVKEVLLW
jgi:hypothetical protein